MQFSVDAILFDIDGTLVDSTAAVERTWRVWAAAHGVDAEELLEGSHGRRSEDTIAGYLPPEQIAESVAYLDDLENNDLDDITALPAAAKLLASLPPDRWAVVTSGNRSLMRTRLQVAGLPIPAVMISSEDVTEGKPDPQGYRMAAELLGFAPERCLVVEDAPSGIEAGLALGGPVLAVATSHPAAEVANAHAVVPNLSSVRAELTAAGLLVTLSL